MTRKIIGYFVCRTTSWPLVLKQWFFCGDAACLTAIVAVKHTLNSQKHRITIKVDKAQGADKKNLAMVTDDNGSVYPGYVGTDMIAEGAVTLDKIKNKDNYGFVSGVLISKGSSGVMWGQFGTVGYCCWL